RAVRRTGDARGDRPDRAGRTAAVERPLGRSLVRPRAHLPLHDACRRAGAGRRARARDAATLRHRRSWLVLAIDRPRLGRPRAWGPDPPRQPPAAPGRPGPRSAALTS